jgi:hypothetical protein
MNIDEQLDWLTLAGVCFVLIVALYYPPGGVYRK